MTDSLDMIERTIVGLRSGFLPADIAQWLDKGLVARTKGESLDKALGISKVGQLRPETKASIKQRNNHLLDAFELIPGDVFWNRIENFSVQIKRFETINWTRDSHYDSPPGIYTPFKTALFNAFSVGLAVPSSTSQLYLLLSRTRIHKSKSEV